MLLTMNITVTTSLPVQFAAESRNDPVYRTPPAPGSGAERQSGSAEKTEPTNLADLWDKYHRAREIYEKACAFNEGTVLPDRAGHG